MQWRYAALQQATHAFLLMAACDRLIPRGGKTAGMAAKQNHRAKHTT